jgi:hypothetical protein
MRRQTIIFNGIPMTVSVDDGKDSKSSVGSDSIDVKFEIIKEDELKKPEPVLDLKELDKIK